MALVHFTLLFHVLLYCSESLCQCSIKYNFLFRYPKISQDLHRFAFATTALFHSSHVLPGVPVSALCWPSLSQPPRWPDLDVTYQLGLEAVLTISVCCVSDQAAASHSSSTCQEYPVSWPWSYSLFGEHIWKNAFYWAFPLPPNVSYLRKRVYNLDTSYIFVSWRMVVQSVDMCWVSTLVNISSTLQSIKMPVLFISPRRYSLIILIQGSASHSAALSKGFNLSSHWSPS